MNRNEQHIDWKQLAKEIAGEQHHNGQPLKEESHLSDKALVEEMKALMNDVEYAQQLETVDTDAAWGVVKGRVSKSPSKRLSVFAWAAAAIAAVVIGSYMFFFSQGNSNRLMFDNEAGQLIQQVSLPDGSAVDINRGSKVLCATDFNQSMRKVELQGEAFFDIARNESKPFVISTSGVEITVLGTSFNVKESRGSGAVVVSVATGLVKVQSQASVIELKAGEAAHFEPLSNRLTKQSVAMNYLAWKTREFTFDNTRLSDVLTTIGEVYAISIQAADDLETDSLVINASFANHDLDFVLTSVCSTFHLQYTIDQKGTYRIHR